MTQFEITFCKIVAELVKLGMDQETAKKDVIAIMNRVCDRLEKSVN